MAKRPKKPIDTGPPEALTHNPFAGLIGTPPAAESLEAPVDEDPREDDALAFAAKVVVRRQTKGRGGKTATRVSGIAASSREAAVTRMKRALGCGATIEGDDVILLGDVGDRAVAWLGEAGARRVVRGS